MSQKPTKNIFQSINQESSTLENNSQENSTSTKNESKTNVVSISSSDKRKLPIKLIVIVIFIILLVLGSQSIHLLESNSYSDESLLSTDTLSTRGEAFRAPEPPFNAVILGSVLKINKFKTLKIDEPFFFYTNNSPLSERVPHPESEYNLVLKKNGVDIYQRKFDAKICKDMSPGDYCAEYDHSNGLFMAYIRKADQLPDEIVFQHNGENIRTIKKPSKPFPTMYIEHQSYEKGRITINWTSNYETKKLQYNAVVSNNNFQPKTNFGDHETGWLRGSINNDDTPIINNTRFSYSPSRYIQGDLKVAIYASDGFRTYVAFSETFRHVISPQIAKIKYPTGKLDAQYNRIQLEAETDAPTTAANINTYEWSSDIDGFLTNKIKSECTGLSIGKHEITLKLVNHNGVETIDSRLINFTEPPPKHRTTESVSHRLRCI